MKAIKEFSFIAFKVFINAFPYVLGAILLCMGYAAINYYISTL